MIGVSGKAVFKFDLGQMQNVITNDTITSFTIQEWAGGMLPSFVFTASLKDQSLIKFFNELSTFKVTYGVDLSNGNNVKNNKFIITRKNIKINGNKLDIYLSGFVDALGWYNDQYVDISENISGIERAISVASKYFNIENNANEGGVYKSDDFMRWVQYGQSDKDHISSVWMHSYLENSCPIIAINSNSDFIIKDLSLTAKSTPKWVIRNDTTTEGNIISYNGVCDIDVKNGLINSWVGYDNLASYSDIEYNRSDNTDSNIKSTMTISKSFDRRNNFKRIPDNKKLNDNTHSNYWKAYQQNIRWLASYSTVTNKITFKNYYNAISVLDLVTLHNYNSSNNSDDYNGDYIVSGVVRSFTKNGIDTSVVLNKESLNIVQEA